ncbi:MAG: chemotaxis protein CheW [Nitrospirae bacterium]|nr:chemotaxis protein CheW [Nitrospirota bacterium]
MTPQVAGGAWRRGPGVRRPAPAESREEVFSCVAFRVGGEEYAIDILKVLEITRPLKVTSVRRAPRWIEGIVNLREHVLPVVDLSRRLGAEPDPALAGERRIVIARTRGQIVGFIVDGVREVLRVPSSRIDPVPRAIKGRDASFLARVARQGERLVIVLDVDLLLSAEEEADLKGASWNPPRTGGPSGAGAA